jgi:type I restriction enzyme, S subunit
MAKVSDVGNVQLGRQRSPKDHFGPHMRPYLRVANVYENRLDLSDVKEMNFSPQEFPIFELKPGDILLNEGQSKELVGRPAMFHGEIPGACFQNTLVRFRAFDSVLPNFSLALFRHYMRSGAFQRVCKWTTNIAHLGAKRFASMDFPVPPMPEQKRIVQKVNAVLSSIDACRERLDRVPLILKKFREAVLEAAVSGRLTEDWREGKRLSDSWVDKAGSEVFSFVTSGSRGWAKFYAADGALFLRIGNLDHNTIELDLSDRQYVRPPKGAEGERTRVRVGDILISITADVGMIGVVRGDLGEAYINQHICLARPSENMLPAFLAYWLASPISGLAQLTSMQRGATKAGLTLGDIRNLRFLLPTLEEQKETVLRIENLFALADTLQRRYQDASSLVEKLTPSVLAKAFRGELVPQDSNDEPAEELLKRIRQGNGSAEVISQSQREVGRRKVRRQAIQAGTRRRAWSTSRAK